MGLMETITKTREIQKILYNVDTSKINGTFYYDETNNFRKFRLNENGFNNNIFKQPCFILGGIYVPINVVPKTDILLTKINLQKSQKEFKFKHFCKSSNSLMDILHSRKLRILFEWIRENKIYLHKTSLDYLFYSIVDIVDTLPDAKYSGDFNRAIKNDLYEVVLKDLDCFLSILFKYKFPNIRKDKIYDFFEEVYDFYISNYEYNNYDINDFSKELLRQMLKAGFDRDGNGFLENNADYLLYDDFEGIYLSTPGNILEAKHIFDEEKDIIKKLKKLDENFDSLLNMKFIKSEENILIQISDAVVGFSGKIDEFVFNHNCDEIKGYINGLGKEQLELLEIYFTEFRKAELFCPFFTNSIMPNVFIKKYSCLISSTFEKLGFSHF